MWKATSEEDWELCENNQVGIQPHTYEPRPISPLTEHSVEQFAGWYLDELRRYDASEYVPRSA